MGQSVAIGIEDNGPVVRLEPQKSGAELANHVFGMDLVLILRRWHESVDRGQFAIRAEDASISGAQKVDGPIARDRGEPSRNTGGVARLAPVGMSPGLEERLLHDVFRGVAVAGEPPGD
jgi:hypothetical protein